MVCSGIALPFYLFLSDPVSEIQEAYHVKHISTTVRKIPFAVIYVRAMKAAYFYHKMADLLL
jgi:phospholipid N-methyltransferase